MTTIFNYETKLFFYIAMLKLVTLFSPKIKAALRAAFIFFNTSGYSYEVKASIMLSSASM